MENRTITEEPVWEYCPSTTTVSDDNEDDVYDWAAKNGISLGCLRSFNPLMPTQPHQLRGARMCLPLTCEVAVVNKTISIQDYVEQEFDDVNVQQFLAWNKCLHRRSTLRWRDTVCVGPHRGRYTPTVIDVATSTVFTTTA